MISEKRGAEISVMSSSSPKAFARDSKAGRGSMELRPLRIVLDSGN